jgi:hypothetical protein
MVNAAEPTRPTRRVHRGPATGGSPKDLIGATTMPTRVQLEVEPARSVEIDPHAARVVLDASGYGHHNYASEFDRCLAVAILKANEAHRLRLHAVYPQLFDAADALTYAADGLAALQEAGEEPGEEPDPARREPERSDRPLSPPGIEPEP